VVKHVTFYYYPIVESFYTFITKRKRKSKKAIIYKHARRKLRSIKQGDFNHDSYLKVDDAQGELDRFKAFRVEEK